MVYHAMDFQKQLICVGRTFPAFLPKILGRYLVGFDKVESYSEEQ